MVAKVLMKMNNKAESNLTSNLIFLILLALFIGVMGLFLYAQNSGAAVWEDYYAKEIVKLINMAEPGDEIVLDIQKGTEIAGSENVGSFSEIIEFKSQINTVCVKLSPGGQTCYEYFNDVDVVNYEIKLGVPINLLSFKVVEKEAEDE